VNSESESPLLPVPPLDCDVVMNYHLQKAYTLCTETKIERDRQIAGERKREREGRKGK